MPRSKQVLLVIAVALLGALVAYLAIHLEWEKTSKRSGMSGEALHNPYHAGMELMRQLDYPSERIKDASRLSELPRNASLLIAHPGGFSDKAQRQTLLAWVRGGGHLVVPLNAQLRDNALIEALGIQALGPLQSSRDRQQLSVEDKPLNVDLDDAEVFDLESDAIWSADLDGWLVEDADDEVTKAKRRRNKNKAKPVAATKHFVTEPPDDAEDKTPTDTVAVYARFAFGQGFVTVGDFEVFQNRQIEHFDHARLFVRLMSLPEDKRLVFMILAPEYPGLLVWLLQHAPQALLGLLLLALACVWRFAPRFGPMRPDPVPTRPGLREHFTACGTFMLHHRSYEALIAPLREEVTRLLTHLRNRHPEADSLPELGATLSGISASEITRALSPDPDSHHEFLRRSQTLAQLRNHCNRMRQAASAPGIQS